MPLFTKISLTYRCLRDYRLDLVLTMVICEIERHTLVKSKNLVYNRLVNDVNFVVYQIELPRARSSILQNHVYT